MNEPANRRTNFTATRIARSAFAAVLLLLAGVIPPVAGAAENDKPKLQGISVGFQGYYKPGNWTPVDVTILGGSESMTGVVELGTSDGDTTALYPSSPQQLLPNKPTRVRMYLKFGGYEWNLSVKFKTASKTVLNERISQSSGSITANALNETERLFLTIDTASAVENAIAIQESDATRVQAVAPATSKVVSIRVEDLPTQWQGYESVEALFVSTTNPDGFASLRNDSAQIVALDRWIRQGGTLVISSGADAATMFDRGPLEMFSPGDYREMEELRRLTALESYSGIGTQISAANVRAPAFDNVTGVFEVREGETPLVIRTVRGFGKVVFVGIDLERAPFVSWAGRGAFVNRLLEYVAPVAHSDENRSNFAYYGYNDLSGQLRSALDHFEGIRLAPFSLVFALVMLYILLIGPGDYFFVKKVLKRMEATWITFPAIVILFSAGAYLLANWMKGSEVRLNQVNIVDYDGESQGLRGTTWANVFAPKTGVYNFSLRPAEGAFPGSEPPRVVLSWMGLTGSGLGGMRDSSGGGGLFSREYSFSPACDTMQNVPIAIWSTKALEARWRSDRLSEPLFESDLQLDEQQGLSGALTSNLPKSLTKCWLLHDGFAYPMDTIEAGATAQVVETRRRNLKDMLKGTTYEGDAKNEIRRSTPTYDYSHTDIRGAAKAMLFHKAMGGDEYTGIVNEYRGFIDMTNLLSSGRAILLGDSEESPVVLYDGEEPLPVSGAKRLTYYRCVFPVAAARTRDK